MYYGEITHNDIGKLLDIKNFFLNKSPHKNKFVWEEIIHKKDFINVLSYVFNDDYKNVLNLTVNGHDYTNEKHHTAILNVCNFEIPSIYSGVSEKLIDMSKSGTEHIVIISCLLTPFIMSENECRHLAALSVPKTAEYWDYPDETHFYISKGCTQKEAVEYAGSTKHIPDEYKEPLKHFNLVMYLKNIYKYKENLTDYKEMIFNDHR